MVRSPEPEDFNGTLMVEWTNVTLGQDAEFVFNEAYEHLLRDGYAVATVSAQRDGVEHLKNWDPERYGSLSVDVETCGEDDASACEDDPLSFDIFTQIANALKENSGDNAPLSGLDVENVIASGQSQSGVRLTTYYNTVQPHYGLFDGFVYWDRSYQLRSDQDVPAISVNSEALGADTAAVTTSEYTRAWDVAGATHASLYGAEYIDKMVLRDESLVGPDGPTSFTDLVENSCEALPPFSTVDSGLVVSAAFDSVREWVTEGEHAAATIQFERDDAGSLIRDEDGRVLGGVHLAQFTAPTAHIEATNGSEFPCSISGHHRTYTDEELRDLYGSHEEYVDQVREAMESAVLNGYVLEEDAEQAVSDAEESSVAR